MRCWTGPAAPVAMAAALVLALEPGARADVPYPTCADAGCSDPADFGAYLFLAPGVLPDDFDPGSGEAWKYQPESGMDIVGAWQRTTGRPDVVIAVLDSGIFWDRADLARKVALNAGELPVPAGCASHDCNGDGFVSVDDFADACAADPNGTGFCDGQDLIRFYADGVDDDGNGYVDDIAGWDFVDDDNDPDDLVRNGHGTGEASDQVAEANNGGGFPGFAPSALFLPLRVADSFVGIDSDFVQAVVYATDRRVDVISEALGTVNASASGQAAVDYAYRRGIPMIASAADEQSRHHNYPAAYEHTIWVNSIRDGDGTFLDRDANGFDVLNGCTNYGGRAWAAIPSAACSSEATSRAGGLTALLLSHARNQIDAGRFSPYPGLGTPFSAEEVRQLIRVAAQDVDHADSPQAVGTVESGLLSFLLSLPGKMFGSSRYPTQPGWDQFTGWGRPDAPTLLDRVTDATIPPEVDLSGSVRWFDLIDPVRTPVLDVVGSARAVRAGNDFDWVLAVGCGVQPTAFTPIASGAETAALEAAVLGSWDPAATAAACGFDPALPITDPDAHTVQLRLTATDVLGNVGVDVRTVAIHRDPTLRFAPRALPGSGESGPALADVNRDGVLDVVLGTGDGAVRALDGATGDDLPGFPVATDPIAVHDSPAWGGEVPVPHEAVIGSVAADDLDGDGRIEIVVPGVEGRLYVFDDHGRRRPGFPVATDPARSAPAIRNRLNDSDPGIISAPTLVDLDAPGAEPQLEIVHTALDGHVYAWRADGTPVAGFPVRLADRDRVSVDPTTGQVTPLAGFDVRSRAAKSLGSPAVGDLDGDGRPEIVVATNEEYGDEPGSFAIESSLLGQLELLLQQVDVDDFSLDVAGRVYAVRPDGNDASGGPFLDGWPVGVPLLTPGVLPTVGTGTTGSAAIVDRQGDGRLQVAIFGAIGPVLLLEADGSAALGEIAGLPRALAVDFPGGGFPNVPAAAGSPDAPFFGALGSGAFGDITGDGLPEYVAPTGGLRKLLDVVVPGQQDVLADPNDFVRPGLAHHQVTAWDPRTGQVLPAFPAVMDDMQFLGSPALADVSGDGVPDVVQGSGAYLLRAYTSDGVIPTGWPKLTHGWHIGSPAPGDVDGDGLVEVVAVTREGNLFVWDTPALAGPAAVAWQGFGRDRRNTQNQASGVPTVAAGAVDPMAGLVWALEALEDDLAALAAELPEPDATRVDRSPAPFVIPIVLDWIEAGEIFVPATLLPVIEWGLRLPLDPVPALEPLHARFLAALRATLVRFLDGARCPSGDTACESRLAGIRGLLDRGDTFASLGIPRGATVLWARGLVQFEGPDSER
ncbi:MAG: S8 family serine peptidase [Myxococcota bacterium]|nr:S8 family serine peptidase [Myxococcota bacterium]